MTRTAYFSDINGQSIELTGYVKTMRVAEFDAKFPGVKGKWFDSFTKKVMAGPDGSLLPITRTINMKPRPSRHECDARCLQATGRIMKCECSCGGKNHGRAAFMCEAA